MKIVVNENIYKIVEEIMIQIKIAKDQHFPREDRYIAQYIYRVHGQKIESLLQEDEPEMLAQIIATDNQEEPYTTISDVFGNPRELPVSASISGKRMLVIIACAQIVAIMTDRIKKHGLLSNLNLPL